MGDANAPAGSEPWLRHITFEIRIALGRARDKASDLADLVRRAEKYSAWSAYRMSRDQYWQNQCGIDGHVVEMLRTTKDDETIGELLERRRAMVAEAKAEPLTEHGGDRKSNDQPRKVTRLISESQTVDYTLRRLVRDGHEEVLSLIERGDLTPNAAAIRVGYRKPPAKKTPQEQLLAAIDRAARSEEVDWEAAMDHMRSKMRG